MWTQKLVVALAYVRVETVEVLVEVLEPLVPREVVEASSVSKSVVVLMDAPVADLALALLWMNAMLAPVLMIAKAKLVSPGMAIEQRPG
jgi:hypothetical protein